MLSAIKWYQIYQSFFIYSINKIQVTVYTCPQQLPSLYTALHSYKDKYTEIKIKGHLLSYNTYNYFGRELILHINVQGGASSQARENLSYIQD